MSGERSRFKESDFEFHRPVDNTDPGFSIKGCKLRWLSASVEVRRAARIWMPLKLSMMPEKVQGRLKEYQPRWFGEGDTVRKKDMTLAFAPIDQVEELRRDIKKTQKLNESVLRGRVTHATGVRSEGETSAASLDDSSQFR
jgi:hypothetical protein